MTFSMVRCVFKDRIDENNIAQMTSLRLQTEGPRKLPWKSKDSEEFYIELQMTREYLVVHIIIYVPALIEKQKARKRFQSILATKNNKILECISASTRNNAIIGL